jgi:hypothetical protein
MEKAVMVCPDGNAYAGAFRPQAVDPHGKTPLQGFHDRRISDLHPDTPFQNK